MADLLLHSPVQFGPDLARQLDELGPVRHLIAPSTAHWTFVADWQKAYPNALTWAVPGLRERPQVRRSSLRIDRDLDDTAPDAWSHELKQGLVRGSGGFCEAYSFHQPSRTLVLADLVQNLEARKLPPLTSALAKLALATRGQTAAHVRAAVLLGGGPARQALEDMIALDPDRVIFSHGTWFETDGAARLARALKWSR